MARTAILCLVIGLLPLSLGCSAKKTIRVQLIVKPECLNGPIVMVDCDDKNPPNCRKSLITFRQGCEQVMTKDSASGLAVGQK